MADAEKKIRFVIEGDDSSHHAATTRAHGDLGKLEGGFGSATGVVAAFRSGIAALGLGMLARELVEAAVATDKMRNAMAAATGSAEQGAVEMQFVREEAQRLGLDLQRAAEDYGKLTASAKETALQGKGARDIFTAVAEASTVLGLSADETSGALRAIGQMISKGSVQSEELRGQLGERLPGAFNIAARAMGVTTAELGKMLQDGKVLSDDFLPKFAAELQNTFGGQLSSAVHSTQAELNRLNTAIFEMKKAVMEEGGGRDALISLVQGATDLVSRFRSVTAEGYRMAMMADKAGGTLTTLGMLLFGPGNMFGNKNSKEQFERMAKWNIMFEQRYMDAEKQLERLANLEAGLNADGTQRKAGTTLAPGKASAPLKKKEHEKNNFTEDSPGIYNWRRNQDSLKEEAEWLKNVNAETDKFYADARKEEHGQSSEFMLERLRLGGQYRDGVSQIEAEIREMKLSQLGEEEQALVAHYDFKEQKLVDDYARQIGHAHQIGMDTNMISQQYALQQEQMEMEKAQRLADIWWNNSQKYVGFAQQMTTMGLQYLLFDEDQRGQIGQRMLATSIRFIGQGLQAYMFGKAKEHLLNAAAAAGRTSTDMVAATANLGILEVQSTAWAAFFGAMSLNPFGGQAFIPAATAMTAVAGGVVPSAIAAVTTVGAGSITGELGMAAAWGAGGILAGSLGEAGASAIESGKSGNAAGYGGGTPTSPVITQPVTSQQSPQVTVVVNMNGAMYADKHKMEKWMEDEFAPAFRESIGRNVNFNVVTK